MCLLIQENIRHLVMIILFGTCRMVATIRLRLLASVLLEKSGTGHNQVVSLLLRTVINRIELSLTSIVPAQCL